MPYGLQQPGPQVLLGVRHHHNAWSQWVREDMMRSVDTVESPSRPFELTDQVSAAHVCMIHTIGFALSLSDRMQLATGGASDQPNSRAAQDGYMMGFSNAGPGARMRSC